MYFLTNVVKVRKNCSSAFDKACETIFGDFYGTNTITVRREEPPCVKGFG